MPGPAWFFTARVNAVEPRIAEDTRNVMVEAQLANPEGKLRPGMHADVHLNLPPRENTLVVPRTAVMTSATGDSIMVVRGETPVVSGTVEQVAVTTGQQIGDNVVIESGLAPGDVFYHRGPGAGQARGPGKSGKPCRSERINKMNFTDLFIRRPVLSVVVSLLILLAGVSAIFLLPIRQYPKMESATINVVTIFPGATQDVMQGFVTTPIAQAIATANGIEYLTSSSSQGKSSISAKLVLNADANRAMTEILSRVQQVKYRLPKGATDPVISKITDGASAVQYVVFYSDTLPVPRIVDFVTRMALPLITAVPGVGAADIYGGESPAMRIWVDPAKLAARGLTANDLAAALRANNVPGLTRQAQGRRHGAQYYGGHGS